MGKLLTILRVSDCNIKYLRTSAVTFHSATDAASAAPSLFSLCSALLFSLSSWRPPGSAPYFAFPSFLLPSRHHEVRPRLWRYVSMSSESLRRPNVTLQVS